MRNTIVRDTLLGLFVFTAFAARSQNVGINLTGAAPVASAILDLNTGVGGHLGFLAPQAALTSNTDNATIPLPATGLIVYNTAATASGPGYYYWNGALWAPISGSAGSWLLTGNSNTVVANNWIGTNDANALQFKVNGQKAGWIDFAAPFQTLFGYEAGNVNTGADNTALGYKSLVVNTTGNDNTSVGWEAMNKNVTGAFNTAVGSGALLANTGSNNSAAGYDALYNNTGGSNSAVGYYALLNNTSGINNTAMGVQAAWSSSVSNGITAFGVQALLNNTAAFNTAIGYQSGKTNTTGSTNTFLGMQADASGGTFNNATAVGANANVGASNSLVLGAINGFIGGIGDVNVGIGTNVPSQKLTVNNGNVLISNGAIGADAATVGQLQLQGTGTGLSTIQAGAQGATNYNYILPTTAPTAGNVMDVASVVGSTVTLAWQVEPNALLQVDVITSTNAATTFAAGTTYCQYKVIGGGGAGGGTLATAACVCATNGAVDMAGAGGSAGQYTEGFITGITGGVSTYQVTIGAGGVGQATCAPTATADGQPTILVTTGPALTIQSNGGPHGPTLEQSENTGGCGPAVSGYYRVSGTAGVLFANAPNAVNILGAVGGYGSITMNGIHACEGGPGANSFFEGGGSQFEERDVQSCNGNPASAYGSGGGGATYADVAIGAGNHSTGGNGSPGIVIIYEYK